jgi:hypothetical protein
MTSTMDRARPRPVPPVSAERKLLPRAKGLTRAMGLRADQPRPRSLQRSAAADACRRRLTREGAAGAQSKSFSVTKRYEISGARVLPEESALLHLFGDFELD